MSEHDYQDGLSAGLADHPPDPARLAYGADRLNDYERGYVDSGAIDRARIQAGPR